MGATIQEGPIPTFCVNASPKHLFRGPNGLPELLRVRWGEVWVHFTICEGLLYMVSHRTGVKE